MLPLEFEVLNEGERYLPNFRTYNAAMHLGHMASYREALHYSYGQRVLDIGCGVGYGAFFLACYGAANVTAIDLGVLALRYAQRTFSHARLTYAQSDALNLPFPDGAFDFVFSSQVIEHVPNVDFFLKEIRRVLVKDGLCLIVTPNQTLFSPSGLSANPHHLSEMNWVTFRQHVQNVFHASSFRGIPQRCLQILPDQITPVTKPNREINLKDYIPQSERLQECENMLGYGGLSTTYDDAMPLPNELKRLAATLEPIFWDGRVQKWIVLGLTGTDETRNVLLQSARQKLTIDFRSPLAYLYCVELDLVEELKNPLRVTLTLKPSSGIRRLVMQVRIQPPCNTVKLIFDALPDTSGAQFEISIEVEQQGLWPFRARSMVKWATSDSEAKCWLDGKRVALPIVIRTFHQSLPTHNH